MCPNGRLFLSQAGSSSTCQINTSVCLWETICSGAWQAAQKPVLVSQIQLPTIFTRTQKAYQRLFLCVRARVCEYIYIKKYIYKIYIYILCVKWCFSTRNPRVTLLHLCSISLSHAKIYWYNLLNGIWCFPGPFCINTVQWSPLVFDHVLRAMGLLAGQDPGTSADPPTSKGKRSISDNFCTIKSVTWKINNF